MKIHPAITGIFCGALVFSALFVGTKSLQSNPTSSPQVVSSHALVRTNIIGLELPQIAGLSASFNVLLGDSIVEALYTGPSSIPIIDAGIGGGGVDSTLVVLDGLGPYKGRIDTIVLGIGVNDAYSGLVNSDSAGRSDYLQNWTIRYKEIIDRSKKLARAVYLIPVLPVENGKELGSKYFDVDMINQMNQKIIEISATSGVSIVPLPVSLAGDGHGLANSGSTTDGVHPTAKTYAELRQAIMNVLKSEALKDVN
ncbi:SGNH/GDSL hydrolase family protein [Rhizobium sp. 768_B6_N1_8]|uniref:SGNH/GDSL hydrolase family protein n=1 Tax=unclassified Rhizobium TaxID=2613769 RepID=UPI003F2804DE